MKVYWTDGSAVPNPGKGGFAVLEIVDGEIKPVALGREKNTTNIRMEGAAMIAAMTATTTMMRVFLLFLAAAVSSATGNCWVCVVC